MFRAGLDTSSAMVCATVHGDGLTAIQYRSSRRQYRRSEIARKCAGCDRTGTPGQEFFPVRGAFRRTILDGGSALFQPAGRLYAGLFICSHNKDVVEQAGFDNVPIVIPAKPGFQPYRDYIGNNIEVVDVGSGQRKVLFSDPKSLQAPNWTPDDKSLIDPRRIHLSL